MDQPQHFLKVRVHRLDFEPSCSGLCVGYERGKWCAEKLANHVMEWLPEFSLTVDECAQLGHSNAIEMIRRAALSVYKSKKFEKRGEFGEILLHALIRQVFNSIPAVSKIYYKTAANETVKGFDAVHVVEGSAGLELWLGEAKFYKDFSGAVTEVIKELQIHTETDYLRDEFILISNKVSESQTYTDELKRLLNSKTSLDEVFAAACIPVLLTYDSKTIDSHNRCDEEYEKAFEAEILDRYSKFASKNLPSDIRIHLFLLPLEKKAELVELLDNKLKVWQSI